VTDWWTLQPQMVGLSTLSMMARLVAAVATLRGVLCEVTPHDKTGGSELTCRVVYCR
jgi:hypothetical protein